MSKEKRITIVFQRVWDGFHQEMRFSVSVVISLSGRNTCELWSKMSKMTLSVLVTCRTYSAPLCKTSQSPFWNEVRLVRWETWTVCSMVSKSSCPILFQGLQRGNQNRYLELDPVCHVVLSGHLTQLLIWNEWKLFILVSSGEKIKWRSFSVLLNE